MFSNQFGFRKKCLTQSASVVSLRRRRLMKNLQRMEGLRPHHPIAVSARLATMEGDTVRTNCARTTVATGTVSF